MHSREVNPDSLAVPRSISSWNEAYGHVLSDADLKEIRTNVAGFFAAFAAVDN